MAGNTISQDQARFTYLGMAIIDTFGNILRDLISKEIPSSDIKQKVQTCTSLPSLNKEQNALIDKASVEGYKDFDITLMCTLLRNVCQTIKKPTGGWRSETFPKKGEDTVGDDIKRIRLIRNKVYGHIASTSISESGFNDYWTMISGICGRMDNVMGNNYLGKLEAIRKKKLDPALMREYLDAIKSSYEKDTMIVDALHEVPTKIIERELSVVGQNEVRHGETAYFTAFIPAALNAEKIRWEKENSYESFSIDTAQQKYRGSSYNKPKYHLVINDVNYKDEGNYFIYVECKDGSEICRSINLKVPAGNADKSSSSWANMVSNRVLAITVLVVLLAVFLSVLGQKGYLGETGNVAVFMVMITGVIFIIAVMLPDNQVNSKEKKRKSDRDLPTANISNPQDKGKYIIIPCNISGEPSTVSLRWTKNGCDLEVSNKWKFSGGTVNEPSLRIKNVNRDDVGVYQCIAENACGFTMSEPKVLELPRIFIKRYLHEGRSIRMVCEIDCSLLVKQVIWKKDGQAVKNDEDLETSIFESELIIVDVVHRHSGLYTCSARNALGMTESDPIRLEIPTVVISCPSQVLYGDTLVIKAEVDPALENAFFNWMISTSPEGNYNEINTSIEKYTVHGKSSSSCILTIRNVDFSDSALYELLVYPDLENNGFYESNKLKLKVIGDVPTIHNDIHHTVIFSTTATLKATIQASPPVSYVKWMKMVDNFATDIDLTNPKYTGSTVDLQNPCLVIGKTDSTDETIYQLNVSNLLGSTFRKFALEITGVPPKVFTSGLMLHDDRITLICKASVTEDSPTVTSVKWFKDGKELTRNYRYKYSHTEVSDLFDLDVSLEIRYIDHSVIGNYHCIITNPVGETNSNMFYIDQLYSFKSEVQAVLCCLFLQSGHCIDLREESWLNYLKASSDFFKCKLQTTDDFEKVLSDKIQDLNKYLDRESDTLSLKTPEELLNSFKLNTNFIDFFLKNACKENIAKYCRTPQYVTKDNEMCFTMDMEQTSVFVDRLQRDILTHCTLQDESIHELVVGKLKIPKEILHWGQKGIETFLENLSHGCVRIYHARGMIVGCAGAGKTTLLKKLKGLPIEEIKKTDSTRGIDVHTDVFTVTEGTIELATGTRRSHFDVNRGGFIAPKLDDGHSTTLVHVYDKIGSNIAMDDAGENVEDMEEMESGTDKAVYSAYKNDIDMEDQINQSDAEMNRSLKSAFDVEEKENQYDDADDRIDKIHKENISGKGQQSHSHTEQEFMQIDTLSALNSVNESSTKCITFLDFAGQIIYYACHQIYLSPRAFYLLVMDMSQKLKDIVSRDVCKEENSSFRHWTYEDFFKYWMRSIHLYSSKTSPVIPIASHAEKKTKEEIRQYFLELWEALPEDIKTNHLDPEKEFSVEIDSDKNMKELKKCIAKLVEQQPYWGELRPASWVLFEHHLTEIRSGKKIKTMQTAQLWDQNEALEGKFQLKNNADMMVMLNFFHDIGVILFFDEEFLRDTIILDIQWFVDCFKHIITDKAHAEYDLRRSKGSCLEEWNKFNENGILSCDLLFTIWRLTNETYISNKGDIMMYMERLGMLAKIEDNPEKWYVPCMNKMHFPTEEFAERFDVSSSICFIFPFLPSVIYYRLIATCLSQLKFSIPRSGDVATELFFQNAVLLQNERFTDGQYVIIGNYKDVIELQIMFIKPIEKHGAAELKSLIAEQLKKLMGTFHTNPGRFTIGYRCMKSMFCAKPITHILEEETFYKLTECPKCKLPKEKIQTWEILTYWNTAEELAQKGFSTIPHQIIENAEIGLRVVRGPNWKWGNQDDGDGHVGTVVEIGKPGSPLSPDKTVIVQWDSGSRTNYSVGYQGFYDLRVLDNAPTGVKHQYIMCDGCRQKDIQGMRWKCSECHDFDLCTTCYMADKHNLGHAFFCFNNSFSKGVIMPKRTDKATNIRVHSYGIFSGAKVIRGPDWEAGNEDGGKGKIGKTIDIQGSYSESGRSMALVKWQSGLTNAYRMGHKGKVDLTYINAAQGWTFYKEHLPVLGEFSDVVSKGEITCLFNKGDKVRVDLNEKVLELMQKGHGGWNPRMALYIGRIGTVHRITDRGDVRVEYEGCSNRWTFHPGALMKQTKEEFYS